MTAPALELGLGRPAAWLLEDMKTDWVPDVLGGFGAAQDQLGEDLETIIVATSTGPRSVTLAPLSFRVDITGLTDEALRLVEANLPQHVCGYRDLLTPYRAEWLRAQQLSDVMSRGKLTLRVDVEKFFSSVSADTIARRAQLPGELVQAMTICEEVFGTPLLPGHRWARRIANAVLAPVDRSISAPFVRWQDDYQIFLDSPGQSKGVLAEVAAAAREIGLELNWNKSGLAPRTLATHFPDPAQMTTQERLKAFQAASEDPVGNRPWIKRMLRAYAEVQDAAAVEVAAGLLEADPCLAPRVASYLAACLMDTKATDAVLSVIETEDDPWIVGRALAAACHSPEVCKAASLTALERWQAASPSAVSRLATRALHAARRGWQSPDDRLTHALLRPYEELMQALPVLDTTL